MKTINLVTIVVAGAAIASSIAVVAADTGSGQRSGHRMGPPPEALTACQGKAAGDVASITLPDGRTIAGTCQLRFRPDAPPVR